MMHGHEKSDSVIVAWKPANKVLRPAVEQSVAEPATAEPVEPRAETEGNADQQSTCRAQSRISAARHRLPAIYPNRPFVISGGLASYGPDLVDQYRRAASYVDR